VFLLKELNAGLTSVPTSEGQHKIKKIKIKDKNKRIRIVYTDSPYCQGGGSKRQVSANTEKENMFY